MPRTQETNIASFKGHSECSLNPAILVSPPSRATPPRHSRPALPRPRPRGVPAILSDYYHQGSTGETSKTCNSPPKNNLALPATPCRSCSCRSRARADMREVAPHTVMSRPASIGDDSFTRAQDAAFTTQCTQMTVQHNAGRVLLAKARGAKGGQGVRPCGVCGVEAVAHSGQWSYHLPSTLRNFPPIRPTPGIFWVWGYASTECRRWRYQRRFGGFGGLPVRLCFRA